MKLTNATLLGIVIALVVIVVTQIHDLRVNVQVTQTYEDTTDYDALNFWDISTEDIRAEDPEGWQALLDSDATQRELGDWAMVQRYEIFTRTYGYAYPGIVR